MSPGRHLLTDIHLALRSSWLYRRTLLEKKRRAFLREEWRHELARANAAPGRLRVGFGPIVTGEGTLGVRKWHIEPIVDAINRTSSTYVCDVFLRGEALRRFDLVVVVRDFDFLTPRAMRRLRRQGTRVFYKIADNPAACRRSYLEDKEFLPLVDGIIASSPLQADDVQRHNRPTRVIGAPILSSVHKQDYAVHGPVRILWQGHAQNLAFQRMLLPLVRRVAAETGIAARLVCHTRLSAEQVNGLEDADYLPWTMENAFTALTQADIAVSIKPPDDPIQQRKPATKVMTYMAGGLPVVCAPSEADKMLIEHGRTGFLAETEEEWLAYLRTLVTDATTRERVGRAARESVLERCSVERVARAHTDLFDEISKATGGKAHMRSPQKG